MSKKKDRIRAESGLIFRDGHLVSKEDWYKRHPTKETVQAQDLATREKYANYPDIVIVKDGKVLDPKDTSAVLAEAEPYYCTKCKIVHRRGKIHTEHHQFSSQIKII